jgi:transposase
LQLKTILNRIQAFVGFVYQDVRLCLDSQSHAERIEITVAAHGGIRARCSLCRKPAPGYDRLPQRRWLSVPVWGIPVWFCYAPRRVACAEHGVVVEYIPWSDGKRPVTVAMMGFLARWARRLSWRETAQTFQTSWEAVYRSVEWFVEWGLAHRQLDGIESIGVDEIHWGHGLKADNFLTVIYQIDAGCRRLLWIGKRRSEKTLRQGLKALGPAVVKGLRFVCSDMWKPYLNVLAAEAKGLNNKIRVITRRSYGFRTFKAMEIALYHTLGRLPEPRGIAFGI